MKTLLLIAGLFVLSNFGLAQSLSGVNGDCTIGGQQTLTQGLPSTGTEQIGTSTVSSGAGVQASFPNCLVTVYFTGTTNRASVFLNNLSTPTPSANPLSANQDGSFTLFLQRGVCYDITISSGAIPMPYSRTYSDVCLSSLTGGGGGSFALQINGVPFSSQTSQNMVTSNGILPVDDGAGVVEFDIQAAADQFVSGCLGELTGADINVSLNCMPNTSYNGTIQALQSNFVTPSGGCYNWLGSVNGQGKICSQTAASNPFLSWPTQSGTLVASALAPLAVNATTGQMTLIPCSPGQSYQWNGSAWVCVLSSSGGGNPQIENLTSDQTGNSFYTTTALTNWFAGSWQFVPNTTTFVTGEVYVPTAQTGATLVLDIYDSDAVAGHTANFQTCDNVITTGTLQVGALTCAAAQTYTTTSTAYQRVTLTFAVQSALTNGAMLVVKIGVAPTGTQPATNLIVYPHFIL